MAASFLSFQQLFTQYTSALLKLHVSFTPFACCSMSLQYMRNCGFYLFIFFLELWFLKSAAKVRYFPVSSSNSKSCTTKQKAPPLGMSIFSFSFQNYLFIIGCTGTSLLHEHFLLSQCTSFSLLWLLLWSTCSGCFSCFVACGTFLDKGSNRFPCIDTWILNHWTTGKTLIFLWGRLVVVWRMEIF